ncbi:MAG: dephospho-CoA kinase [Gammaproteobacteria bacterium]|nr:MAG: dephospho-CoA kinase [Gammaproteobacteria bacterium]
MSAHQNATEPVEPVRRPLVIGLTGGIGSGKSVVAKLFSRRDVPVIDADRIARDLVEPGTPALETIINTFGPDYLQPDGQLDRNRLRRLVFTDPALRHQLESILHPLIRNNIKELINSIREPYCIVVIPLLLETGQSDLVDRILVIEAPEETRIDRVARRDRLPADEIHAILQSQTDRETRLAAADDVIVNAGTIDELAEKVQTLHETYLALAAAN